MTKKPRKIEQLDREKEKTMRSLGKVLRLILVENTLTIHLDCGSYILYVNFIKLCCF